jgi:hypothetical protein
MRRREFAAALGGERHGLKITTVGVEVLEVVNGVGCASG